MSIEELLLSTTYELEEKSKIITTDELLQLIELLNEKDNTKRYQAYLLLQYRSAQYDDVYPFWDIFAEKLKSKNSYQRNIGVNLIAENTKWDRENKLDEMMDQYLLLLHDEKPITIRQCIQALNKIVPYKKYLHSKIADELMEINISEVKETMRKLVLLDILNVLNEIKKDSSIEKIESYILNAALINPGIKVRFE